MSLLANLHVLQRLPTRREYIYSVSSAAPNLLNLSGNIIFCLERLHGESVRRQIFTWTECANVYSLAGRRLPVKTTGERICGYPLEAANEDQTLHGTAISQGGKQALDLLCAISAKRVPLSAGSRSEKGIITNESMSSIVNPTVTSQPLVHENSFPLAHRLRWASLPRSNDRFRLNTSGSVKTNVCYVTKACRRWRRFESEFDSSLDIQSLLQPSQLDCRVRCRGERLKLTFMCQSQSRNTMGLRTRYRQISERSVPRLLSMATGFLNIELTNRNTMVGSRGPCRKLHGATSAGYLHCDAHVHIGLPVCPRRGCTCLGGACGWHGLGHTAIREREFDGDH